MSIIQAAGPALRRVHVCVGGMWRCASRTVIDDDGTVRVEHDDIPSGCRFRPQLHCSISFRVRQSIALFISSTDPASQCVRQRGGDMIRFFEADWRVTQVLEVWDQEGWSKLIVTRQSDIDAP